jgi:hypothetical protein
MVDFVGKVIKQKNKELVLGSRGQERSKQIPGERLLLPSEVGVKEVPLYGDRPHGSTHQLWPA